MSKDEFLKIQTCVLKVNIHCDGCKHKVKKILQKIEGVYTIKIDSEQSKVTVSGNVDPSTLIKKLVKNGKHAETLGAQKSNSNNQNHLNNNQFKNLQIDNGKGGNNNNKGGASKGGGGGINNNNNSQQKGGNNNNNNKQGKGVQNPQSQQMKGFEDVKMGQFMKDMKMPMAGKDQNAKSVKFKLPEDDDMSDDDFDDDFDDDDEDDFDDDDLDNGPPHKMKPGIGNGPGGMGLPNMMHNMMNGQNPQVAKGGGGNAKKGGGSGNFPVQMNHGGGGGGSKKGGNGSKNNNNNNHNNKIQGGSMGGKNSGGGNNGKGQNSGGGNNNGQGKNGGGGNFMENGGKKVGGMNDGPHGLPSMMGMGGGGANMGNMPMGNLTAVQGLQASSAVGGGGGYFQGGSGGPSHGPGVGPYHHHQQQQQQLAAMMMNQQRANGNERFQPMMYARPAAAVSYMPPYSPYYGGYPYPYSPNGERVDQYSMFSDENTNGCAVM